MTFKKWLEENSKGVLLSGKKNDQEKFILAIKKLYEEIEMKNPMCKCGHRFKEHAVMCYVKGCKCTEFQEETFLEEFDKSYKKDKLWRERIIGVLIGLAGYILYSVL